MRMKHTEHPAHDMYVIKVISLPLPRVMLPHISSDLKHLHVLPHHTLVAVSNYLKICYYFSIILLMSRRQEPKHMVNTSALNLFDLNISKTMTQKPHVQFLGFDNSLRKLCTGRHVTFKIKTPTELNTVEEVP